MKNQTRRKTKHKKFKEDNNEKSRFNYLCECYELNVRYIAVNDNEYTDKGLSDFVPFKNLFNDNYS